MNIPPLLCDAAPAGRLLCGAVCLLVAAGCVERKMLIRSDPPGALITLDGQELETRTPAEVPFDFGGERAVTLAVPGRRVLETTAHVADPWFTYFPLDIGAEFLWPGTIHDVQTFDYKLEAYQPLDKALTQEQKSELRQKLAGLKLRAATYRAGGSQGPGKADVPPVAPPESAPKK